MGHADEFHFEVVGELPPLKGEARSILSQTHPQAARVRALLEAAQVAKAERGFAGFGTSRIGMQITMRPVGALKGDATNALGGIGDSLQSRRTNIDLSFLGDLANAFLYVDDAQIREVIYREDAGKIGYALRFWNL